MICISHDTYNDQVIIRVQEMIGTCGNDHSMMKIPTIVNQLSSPSTT